MPAFQCHACGAAVSREAPIPRDAECENCGADLRACVNCRHYDTRYNNACKETEADPVADKQRRNFCEFFEFSREPFGRTAKDASREAAARAKLEALFGGGGKAGGQKPPGTDPAAEARRRLEGLFGKPGEGDKEG